MNGTFFISTVFPVGNSYKFRKTRNGRNSFLNITINFLLVCAKYILQFHIQLPGIKYLNTKT